LRRLVGLHFVTNDEQAVRAVIDAVSAAWADNDVTAFVAHYADDATAILPGFSLLNREVLRAAMGTAFEQQLKGSRRVHQVQSVRFLDDSTAIVISRSATVPSGFPDPARDSWSMATWLFSSRSGRWLIEAYHDCPAS
jgi:uncharacterized protein (TIGR02246 family)